MSQLIFATGPVKLNVEGENRRRAFAAALSSVLGIEVEVRPAQSYSELLHMVDRRIAHLAWLPPALYVQVRKDEGVHLLVCMDRGGAMAYRGALFVRDDSPIKEPADLAGARVAWVDPSSCAGFLFPRLELRERGLDPRRLFVAAQSYGSHDKVVWAVDEGKADVGATYVSYKDPLDHDAGFASAGWAGPVGMDKMRAILVTEEIPSDVICATAALRDRLLLKFRDRLLRLHESEAGAASLKSMFRTKYLQPANDRAYDLVERALYASMAEKELVTGSIDIPDEEEEGDAGGGEEEE